MTCLHCGAETTNGLALCELCRRYAATSLEYLPVYFRNLARWRPGRGGGRQVPDSRALYDGEGHERPDHISRALDEALNALTTWARMLKDDRGITPPTGDTESEQVEALCRWLNKHLASIATLEWAGEFLRRKRKDEDTCDSVGYHEWRLRLLTETIIPGWYAGTCRRDGCEASTYVVPGLTWVTCPGCGATTYARDHINVVIDEASDWWATPKRLAEAIVALVDSEQSVERLRDRVRKWGDRGHLEPSRTLDSDGDPVGPKRYRLGDVLDRLRAEGPTRLAPDAVAAAEA